jgi:hypothetical protein
MQKVIKRVYLSCMIRVLLISLIASLFACSSDAPPTRTYRMGFMNSAPRYDDFDLILETLQLWTPRADAAIISTEVPWDSLLAGKNAAQYVVNNYKGLAEYYRSLDLTLWVYIDPQNGLDRAHDAVALQEAGRSIADTDMQLLYRRFVVVMDSILKPEHLGLAMETNLIRGISTPAIYNGVKNAAINAAAELQNRNSTAKLSISIQVDFAWGTLGGGPFQGIAQDLTDFPFIEEIGLSSYPYFGFDDPNDIPANYYARLLEDTSLPAFVSEGGWASASVSTPDITFNSSPLLQQQYIRRQHVLLQQALAIAWFQLPFTDIDIESLPDNVPDNIQYFASLGLVDTNLDPKPALKAWDQLFRYRYRD